MSIQIKIAAFLAAREVFLAADEDHDARAWEKYCSTEHAVIIHPCVTIEDVRIKARFFLDCEPAYDTIRNCFKPTEETLRPFLRSLTGEVPA